MDIPVPAPLLGGLSPSAFMRRHWQKSPLLVRNAMPGAAALLSRAELFELASRDSVESRLVERRMDDWRVRPGPFKRRALPPLKQPHWTLLVQGVDLHVDAVHALLQQFSFVPQARLDDVMLSFASAGGGVGPHLDSYDVFLLQVAGQRRWRIGRTRDHRLVEGLPLKILAQFEPEDEWLLAPGDVLYLPPRWAHDGVAVGEGMTASIGFRAPAPTELARELLLRLADAAEPAARDKLYGDATQPATAAPGAIPGRLQDFAVRALRRAVAADEPVRCALGEWLSEPKERVWFDIAATAPQLGNGVRLDRRTRMLYDEGYVYINGESFRIGGRDARLLRRLADQRCLGAREMARFSAAARRILDTWGDDGWLHVAEPSR